MSGLTIEVTINEADRAETKHGPNVVRFVGKLREMAVRVALALLRTRYLIQAQPLSLLSGPEKRFEIKKWQAITGYRLFVETGTFLGQTTVEMADVFDHCWTVEIDKKLYEEALSRFHPHSNITAILGSSGDHMEGILEGIDSPAIFWLDGHYSSHDTGRADIDTPILRELDLILKHPIKNHVILVDDARDFLGINGYPTISQLRRFVRSRSPYRVRISNDIIHLVNEAL